MRFTRFQNALKIKRSSALITMSYRRCTHSYDLRQRPPCYRTAHNKRNSPQRYYIFCYWPNKLVILLKKSSFY